MSKLAKALTAAAGNAGSDPLYAEDVFSTYLYTGDGTNPHVITNGINLADEGGLIWTKARDSGSIDNVLVDTERGTGWLVSNSNAAAAGTSTAYLSFNTDGYNIDNAFNNWNGSTIGDYVSWTFRKAKKFFDVVTYTGNGVAGREIAHNLGSVPACMIIKNITTSGDLWMVYHKDSNATIPEKIALILNDTVAAGFDPNYLNSTTPTSSVFTLGGAIGTNRSVNDSGENYVAYLFASDAGGFGDDGDENIIKCGSYTGNGTYLDGPEIDLGFEPQWLLIKSTGTQSWRIADNMRGIEMGTAGAYLSANLTQVEVTSFGVELQATGFKVMSNNADLNSSGQDYIYIAIRRPMKTPESGTEVFAVGTNQEVPSATSGFYSGFPVDMAIKRIITASQPNYLFDRLRGGQALVTNTTAAETGFGAAEFDHQNGWYYDSDPANTNDYSWMFKRATGFFDVVAYTGNGTPSNTVRRDLKHNLGVAPELAILKRLNSTSEWQVAADGKELYLNLTLASQGTYTPSSYFNATDFDVEGWINEANNNVSGSTYIAYLFATLAGVSKVGSYTGTGSNVDVDCGFSAGARFILIKRTDSASNWYLWDSARGITAGNDPYIQLNNTTAQNSGQDAIDPLASGFTVTAAADVNQPGGTYIFLAIA